MATTLLTWELNRLVTWLRTVATLPSVLPPPWQTLEESLAFEAEHQVDVIADELEQEMQRFPERQEPPGYRGPP
jgi:hypothetical protein